MENVRLAIIGLGPYSWHSHLMELRDLKIVPKIAIELDSFKTFAREILDTCGFTQTILYTIPDKEKDSLQMPQQDYEKLSHLLKENSITHAILSSEPKSHYVYLKILIANNISIFCDKPLVAIEDCTIDSSQADKVFIMQNEILKMAEEKNIRIDLNVSRRFNPAHNFIRQTIHQTSTEWDLPITNLQIFSSGGKWHHPNEMAIENHPFKYGYGHLYHSGFHFVDSLCSYLEAQKQFDLLYNNIKLHSLAVYPKDIYAAINRDVYQKIYHKVPPSSYNENIELGEFDFETQILFKNNDKIITKAHLNLMSSGFSRRDGLSLHFNSYGKIGRVRHEYVNIHMGPFLNIQFHEYQLKKEKDKKSFYDTPVSEILIFRNSEAIGGQPFQKILVEEIKKTNPRQSPLLLFLKNEESKVYLQNLKFSLDLFAKIGKSLADQQK